MREGCSYSVGGRLYQLMFICVVTGYGKSTRLSNCKFHDRVKTDASRSLSFLPPEGEVVFGSSFFYNFASIFTAFALS